MFMQKWGARLTGLIIGASIILIFRSNIDFKEFFFMTYNKVGITIIALLPLAIWAVFTAVQAEKHNDVTLSYIGTTAQRVGLLGTVIGIVAATLAIGSKLNSGAAAAVTGALPAVGQAMISTAVGFIIAITCDFFRYINVRQETQEK
ncbi:MAG: MotA/TolQ/ExbB proton channel family protein [Victivallales bacterium]|nr:MotA/TolQ/ExbB proton channel family protein [Victivallales bacterium]